LLTGGTGFVGSHVARALCSQGWHVRAMARQPAVLSTGVSRDLPLEIVRCDLSRDSVPTLSRALSGCRAVIHVAGLVKARSLAEYREVNVHGTERLLDAARESAPDALFVLISSQAAAGPAHDGRPVTEKDTPRPVSWYGRSKLEAEEAVASRWAGPWIVLRPSVVYGPGDRGLLTFFAAAARGWVPVPAGGSRIHLIEASRAAHGIALAAARPDLAGNRAFLCDPETVSIASFAAMISRLPARRARVVRMPDGLVRAAGLIASFAEALTRRSLAFNSDKAKEILAGDWICEPETLQKHLPLPPPSPLEYGLKKTWDWYGREGWLPL